ncbi:MAG: family 16 glycosylhydrolase [Candidatus Dormiibacterota bacterium]
MVVRPPAPRRRFWNPLVVVTIAGMTVAAVSTYAGLRLAGSPNSTPAAPAGWTTAFSDSFSGAAGSTVDSQWKLDDVDGTSNGSVQSYDTATANLSEDGADHLDITPVDSNGSWTSSQIATVADNFSAPAGGELEVSASIQQPNPAKGQGYWPAFWMLGSAERTEGGAAWPENGEIDVMESINAQNENDNSFWSGSGTNDTSGLYSCSGCDSSYNTYSVIINRTVSNETLTYYLNGTQTYQVSESQVGTAQWQAAIDNNGGFYLILDVAMGGSWPGNPTSSTTSGAAMGVGYVAVYETTGGATASPAPTATPSPKASARPTSSATPAPSGSFVTGTSTVGSSLSLQATAGDLLVLGEDSSGTATVTDSAGDTWATDASTAYGNGEVQTFSTIARGGSDTISVSRAGALSLAEYSGYGPLGQTATTSGVNTTSLTGGQTVTLSDSGDLVVGVAGQSYNGSGFSAGSGFTLREQAASEWDETVGLEDTVATSQAGQSVTMTSGGSGYYGTVLAAFTPSDPASTTPTPAPSPTPSPTLTPAPTATPTPAPSPSPTPGYHRRKRG